MKKKKYLQILAEILVIVFILITGRSFVYAASSFEYDGGHIFNPDDGGGPLNIKGIGKAYCCEHGRIIS